jgi:quercetin dioxygenase-like cupin family protein
MLASMQKMNIKDVMPDQSMLKYFDGRVEIRKMITDAASKEVETYLVTFEDGARTKLHYHETDQVLLATEGDGIVVLQTKVEMMDDNTAKVKMDEVHYLGQGDFVCIPAYVWHWHGAVKGKNFAHIQIKKPGRTVWFE